jgi:hypothetical protein
MVRSSGSSLSDDVVELTRPQNITVGWRRSALSHGLRSVAAVGCEVVGLSASSSIARNIFRRSPSKTPMSLRCRFVKSRRTERIDVILGKASGIPREPEFLQPLCDRLHCEASSFAPSQTADERYAHGCDRKGASVSVFGSACLGSRSDSNR